MRSSIRPKRMSDTFRLKSRETTHQRKRLLMCFRSHDAAMIVESDVCLCLLYHGFRPLQDRGFVFTLSSPTFSHVSTLGVAFLPNPTHLKLRTVENPTRAGFLDRELTCPTFKRKIQNCLVVFVLGRTEPKLHETFPQYEPEPKTAREPIGGSVS